MDAKTLQGVAYIVFIIFLTIILYGYILHLYRSEKRGKKNYEKYGKIALDDELSSPPVEPLEEEKKESR